jgi:hypothetical protein
VTHYDVIKTIHSKMLDLAIIDSNTSQKDFFIEITDCSEEQYNSSYRETVSNWFKKDKGSIRKTKTGGDFKNIISEKLFIPNTIWGMTKHEKEIKSIIEKSLKKYKDLKSNKKYEIDLDILFSFVSDKVELNEEEVYLKHKNSLKSVLEDISNKEWDTYSKELLFKLTSLYYENAYYKLIIERIKPRLDYIKDNLELNKIIAYSYASSECGDYIKAIKFFEEEIQKNHNHENIVDMRTTLISNIRRFVILDEGNKSKDEFNNILNILIEHYHNICKDSNYHYYPTINLAYLVVIRDCIFGENSEIKINELYQNAKSSLNQDFQNENATNYDYAKISEMEFKILINSSNPRNHIYEVLVYFKDRNLNKDFITKVLRQFEYYNMMIEKYSNKDKNTLYLELEHLIYLFKTKDHDISQINKEDFL